MTVVRDLSKVLDVFQPVGMVAAYLSPEPGLVEEEGVGIGVAEFITLFASI